MGSANSLWFAMVVGTWFASSVITEVCDKHFMTQLGLPLTLALWKFVASVPCGLVAVLVTEGLLPLGIACTPLGFIMVAAKVMPLAALIVVAKLFTYVSYGLVPLSTAQLVKATTPIVSVAMTRLILGERFGWQSYLSLVPIAVGVILSVGVDVEFNALGVAAALASCIFAAAQGIAMKSLYIAADQRVAFRALTLNMYTATCCSALLLPAWLGVQMGYLPAAMDGGKLILADRRILVHGGGRLWFAIITGALTQYVQSACGYLFLERVSPATSVVVVRRSARHTRTWIPAAPQHATPATRPVACGSLAHRARRASPSFLSPPSRSSPSRSPYSTCTASASPLAASPGTTMRASWRSRRSARARAWRPR